MKKFVNLILAITMFLSTLPTVSIYAGAKDRYLFKNDFDNINIGGKMENVSDPYKEVAQLGNPNSIWNSLSGEYAIVRESALLKNHLLKISNKGSEQAKTNFAKSLRIDISNNGIHCFELSFKLKSLQQNVLVSMQSYGGSGGTIKPFSLEGMNVGCMGSTGSCIEMDKWNDISIKMDLDTNTVGLYINNIHEYEGIIWNDYAERRLPALFVINFEVSVEPGKECYFDDIYICEEQSEQAEKVADKYDEYIGVHPRVFADSNDFARIAEMVKKEEYRPEWESLLMQADGFVENGAQVYYDAANTEDSWMRDEADAIMNLCLVAKITGEEKYRKALRDAIATVMNYPQWGRGDFYNSDLACAHCLVLSSIYYDWFYDDLEPNERYLIQCTVAERGGRMSKLGWWRNSFAQNHSWNCSSALAVASAAFFEDIPDSKNWIYTAKRMYDRIFSFLGEDGSTHEGTMYWNYGTRFVAYYLQMAKKFLGLDYTDNEFLKNTANFFQSMLLSANTNPLTTFRFSDFSDNIEALTTSTLAYLAARNQDEVTNWYTQYLRERIPDEKKYFYAMWYLLYLDENLGKMAPKDAELPLNMFFEDIGLLFMRTGWEEDDTVIAYRCGPALGKAALTYNSSSDLGTGHIHHDINSMQIFANREHLLAETVYGGRATASHNTILVNGCGQLPDAEPDNGFVKVAPRGIHANPHITKVEEKDEYVYSIGDGTEIYDFDNTGLKKWKRHFLYLKPDVLLVVDDIETEVREEKIPVEIRYFPEEQNFIKERDGRFTFAHNYYNFVIKPFQSGNSVIEGTKVHKLYNHTDGKDQTVIRIINDDSEIIQPVAMSWSDADKKPFNITANQPEKGVVEFYVGKKIVRIDTINEQVSLEDITSDVIVKVNNTPQKNMAGDLINRDDRYFVNQSQMKAYFGITSEEKDGEIILTNGKTSASTVKGSSTIKTWSEEIAMDTSSFEFNGEIYIPIRYLVLAFKMACEWEPDIRAINVLTDVDLTDASIYSLSVNSTFVSVEEGKDTYEIDTFDAPLEIVVVPNSPIAEVKKELCDGTYGTSKITVVSGDLKHEKTYYVTTNPIRDICGTHIHNFGISSSDSNVGENAFDKSLETRWSAQGAGQYIWYDLGSVVDIDAVQVAMFNGDKRTTEFDIEVSDDGESYSNAGHFESSGTTAGLETYKLDNAKGRFVRFVGYGAKGSGWNSLLEFAVMISQ